MIQSPAIIEWLEERHPSTRAAAQQTPTQRAHVRALAAIVGCDVHPLEQPPRAGARCATSSSADEATINAWCATWISGRL